MSGIFGYLRKGNIQSDDQRTLSGLSHWNKVYGAEASETFAGGHWGIGCHIEHLSEAYPWGGPILRQADTMAVIDAVIYNRDQLADLLNIQNLPEISDEVLLLQLIREKGMEALAKVNGDFAGAIYEEGTNSWKLFRDHMGVRPLYYYTDETVFAFSTDLRGLAAMPEANLKLNANQLYLRMMGYNDLTLCETEYDNIRCVRPAAWTSVSFGEQGPVLQERCYWRLRQQKIRRKRDEDYVTELRQLITDAVKRRLDAVTGLVGGELSGGLDSGVVDILINRLGREGRYFSWSQSPEAFPLQDGDDERKVIRDICQQENITCEFNSMEQDSSIKGLFETVQPAYVNTPTISRTAQTLKRQGVRAIFTGHGGDEGVSHRLSLAELWEHREYGAFLKSIWDTTEGKKLRLLRTAKRTWRTLTRVIPEATAPYHNTDVNAEWMLTTAFKARQKEIAELHQLHFSLDPAKFVEQGGSRKRLDNLAIQAAQNGVRYMIPFLDYRVIDFAVSIPRRLYLKNGISRWIYREAFRDMIPDSLYHMGYKDIASQRNRRPEGDFREAFLREKELVLSRLDKDFWKAYLNFEQMEALALPEDYTSREYAKAVFALNDLIQCGLLQNVKNQAKKWCEEVD